MTISVQIGELGATRQSWRTRSIRDLLVELIKEYPDAGEGKLLVEYIARCRNSDDDLDAGLTYAFDNNYRALRKQVATAREKAAKAARRAQEAQAAAEVAIKHAEIVQSIKEQVLMLNLEMPNGKRMRHCTGAEMEKFGGAFQRIGKKVGKTKTVGSALNEQEVRKLLQV